MQDLINRLKFEAEETLGVLIYAALFGSFGLLLTGLVIGEYARRLFVGNPHRGTEWKQH